MDWCRVRAPHGRHGVRRDTGGGVIYDVETAGGDDGAEAALTVASEPVASGAAVYCAERVACFMKYDVSAFCREIDS